MDDKLQYANMLEIPVQTATVTTAKPTKKRAKPKKVTHDEIKEELLNKINSSPEEQVEKSSDIMAEQLAMPIDEQQDSATYEQQTQPTKRRFKLNAISIQLLIIGALIVTILITNSVYPNSGLNVFMRGIFGNEAVEEVSVDNREYSEFTPVLNADGQVSMQDGVMTITGEGSVYSTVSGKITAITEQEDGTFSMDIMHSEKFLSHITGLDRVYSEVGDSVFCTIPVGYVDDAVSMCFKDSEGEIISDFQVVDNSVVWAE